MPKQYRALSSMPPLVLAQLKQLGEHLSIARKRRKASRRAWAERIGVTEPTLARMEKGDPAVAFGSYATALWLIGRAQALGELAAPELDLGALDSEVRAASLRSVRKGPSVEARLRGTSPGDGAPHDGGARPLERTLPLVVGAPDVTGTDRGAALRAVDAWGLLAV